jgi:ribosomal protein S6--L-glutamate ligase
MKRTAKEGEFRSNLHRGGTAELIKLSRRERETAVRAAAELGLTVCGVDLLPSDRGPLVLEVNSSPGLEGIEKATEKDIAGEIIAYLEKQYALANPVSKPKSTTRKSRNGLKL